MTEDNLNKALDSFNETKKESQRKTKKENKTSKVTKSEAKVINKPLILEDGRQLLT